jgi:hypothetical protein
MRRVPGLVLLAVLASPALALAEDVVAYEAEGDAPTAGADPRVAALDDAFAHAVTAALADVVAPDVRAARKGDLDREIVGHARLWVTKFSVTKDETDDARRHLIVSVKIDRDKLRARLGELDITTVEGGAPALPGAKSVTVLVRVASESGVQKELGVSSLTSALRAAGMIVKKAPASAPDVIDDATAAQLAEQAKADEALVAGVTVGAFVPVRGQQQPAALVSAKLRMLDHGRPVGQGTAIAAARGEDGIAYAVDRAVTLAVTDVLPPVPHKLGPAGAYTGDDTPIGDPGVVLVRLPSRTPFSMVLEEQHYLAGAKGVRAASLRRLSPAGWVVGVTTELPIERIAAIAKRPPATDTSAAVKIVGDVVEVALSGAP